MLEPPEDLIRGYEQGIAFNLETEVILTDLGRTYPAFFFIWLIVGALLLIFFIRRSPERYNRIGHFVRTND